MRCINCEYEGRRSDFRYISQCSCSPVVEIRECPVCHTISRYNRLLEEQEEKMKITEEEATKVKNLTAELTKAIGVKDISLTKKLIKELSTLNRNFYVEGLSDFIRDTRKKYWN